MTNRTSDITAEELAGLRIRSIGKPTMALAVIAALGLVAALVNCQFVDDGPQRFLSGWLVAFAFVLSVSLGSLFFVLIQHLMRAGWSVSVRRIAEFFSLNIVIVGLLFIPIAWSVWQGDGLIYEWSKKQELHATNQASSTASQRPELQQVWLTASSGSAGEEAHDSRTQETEVHADAHHASKPWQNNHRFLITWVVLLTVWIVVAVFYYRNSVAQDKTGDVSRTRSMEWWSGIATILFAYSLTLAAFDLLMSVDASWYSTIFGVYYFAGCAVAGLATMLLTVLMLKRFGYVPATVSDIVFTEELQRDLGRLLFAFIFFWGYIAFSQYMLLWYAHMPETTGWLVRRGMSTANGYTNSWGWLAVLLLLAHFVIPFCAIMSRHVKKNANAMIFWTIWMLVVHYFDLYWIVIPQLHSGFTISFIEIGTALFVVAIYALSAMWIASRSCLIAVGDPRLNESLTRQPMY